MVGRYDYEWWKIKVINVSIYDLLDHVTSKFRAQKFRLPASPSRFFNNQCFHFYFPTDRKEENNHNLDMSALFNFHSFLTVVMLGICTCTYLKMHFPVLFEQRTGFKGVFWKAARIGERLSPGVALGCFTMGISIIFF
ncbi:unnamed protein product [Fraxinus pennsylvanica]|uniref:Protein kish n=1 Tax=Fraxinus pennsylvanica TaxID=56036 RepID=A0AAD1ZE00_9LAMI|nr:unnamed protein product [Fraxinus pennsylvanica]